MSANEDDWLLYGGLEDAPRLASAVELRKQLACAVEERATLATRLKSLQTERQQMRDSIELVTRNACVVLATARLELQRLDVQLAEVEGLPPASAT